MVRFQHLHPICIGRQANVGNKRTTSKLMILVEFSNLTFDPEADITWVSNVKFIPLGRSDEPDVLTVAAIDNVVGHDSPTLTPWLAKKAGRTARAVVPANYYSSASAVVIEVCVTV